MKNGGSEGRPRLWGSMAKDGIIPMSYARSPRPTAIQAGGEKAG